MFNNLSKNPSVVIFDASKKQAERLKNSELFKDFNKTFYSLKKNKESNEILMKEYSESEEVNQNCGEITVLQSKSLLNGIAKYPYRSKYTLFRFSLFNIFFYMGMIGMIRRYIVGLLRENNRIEVLGFYKLTDNPFDIYLVFKNQNSKYTTHFSINDELGYKGLLDHLNETGKKYTVVRFFEKLPDRYREGGDMDILVEDDLFNITSGFLSDNVGTEMVDMYSVTGPSNAAKIPYHTPYLSRKILNEYVLHNGYRVPSQENYLHSFIYHCLYHKGLSSGIETKYNDLTVSDSPDNDYLAKIHEIAEELNIKVGSTLEELDQYMKSVGWRPHLDTLELLSSNNKWLAKHVNSEVCADEDCIVMCVLKKGFLEYHSLDSFEEYINKLGFQILKKEILECDRALLAYNHLRGGNWSATNEEQYSPGVMYTLFDTSVDGYIVRKNNLAYNPRSKKIKLRKKFDTATQSHIHMTDNTHQSLEYIEVLYNGELSSFIQEIKEFDKSHLSINKFGELAYIVNYKIKSFPRKFKDKVLSKLRSFI